MTKCPICDHEVFMPPNRRVRICNWCGIDWECDNQTGLRWIDPQTMQPYPCPPTASMFLGTYLWDRIELQDGMSIRDAYDHEHLWEAQGPLVMTAYCQTTKTLYIAYTE